MKWPLLCLSLACSAGALAHKGPDPVAHWLFESDRIRSGSLEARLGPDAEVSGKPGASTQGALNLLRFDGRQDALTVADDYRRHASVLPKRAITVAAWFSVEEPLPWGSVCSIIQDNGEAEAGWVLGYSENVFTFGLASKGADDGNGKMTYLRGRTEYQPGKLYHVVGVYDGAAMTLYVNGRKEGESSEQSGDILYPAAAPWTLAQYKDSNEDHRHKGRIREVAVYDLAAQAAWVQEEFAKGKALAEAAPVMSYPQEFKWLVAPYLQFGTQTEMTVACETTRPAKVMVEWGESADALTGSGTSAGDAPMQAVRLTGLKPDTAYYYKVTATEPDGRTLEWGTGSFQTACGPGTPYAFAVISDTQNNPAVSKQVSDHLWSMRPRFAIHSGDLVGTGSIKREWMEQYFPGIRPLTERVPIYPVLGNHEVNAKLYYDYMRLPQPEYYYSFRYGNAQFFMLDSNKNCDPDSEQYKWLSQELAKSTAKWKFVCHHHPPYSSDENDYGDLWKGKSTWGDLRMRPMTELYDRHNVDIVWNGHIHSYERTWPLRAGRAVTKGGTIYMITGGGGGHLETPAPIRSSFSNTVRRGHHGVFVAVNDGVLELKSFDQEGRLFDRLVLRKD